jgi:hypothetical protein
MVAWLLVGPLAIWIMSLVFTPMLRKLAQTSGSLLKSRSATGQP